MTELFERHVPFNKCVECGLKSVSLMLLSICFEGHIKSVFFDHDYASDVEMSQNSNIYKTKDRRVEAIAHSSYKISRECHTYKRETIT